MSLSVSAGDLNSLLPDEDSRRLYIGMKDHLLSTSLDDITQPPRKVCAHPRTHTLHVHKNNKISYFRETFTLIQRQYCMV